MSKKDSTREINSLVKVKLMEQKKQLQKFHEADMKKIRFTAELDAVEFVKRSAKDIMYSINKEYQALNKQFVRFRETTWTHIDRINENGERMVAAELGVAQSFPVYEQRLNADPKSPFRLFDCLIPAMRQHVRIPEAILPKRYVTDIKLQIDLKRAKEAVKLFDTRHLNAENRILKQKVEQLQDELESVNWYIAWELRGKSPEMILLELDQTIREKKQLQLEIEHNEVKHLQEIDKWEEKLEKLQRRNKHLQNSVIKPLIMENKVKDVIIQRVKTDYDSNLKLLKMVETILRIPAMCTEF